MIALFSKKKEQLNFENIFSNKNSRNTVYNTLDDFYLKNLPLKFIRHRKFFEKNRRGFGEDAFHSMWYFLFSEFKPINCLEIGVYRGQTLTLWKLLSNHLKYESHVTGVSPFSSAGDSVSNYSNEIDYLADTKSNHEHFGLQYPEFCVDFSTGEKAQAVISSKKWDLIYIDGSHDYDVVCQDWAASINNLSDNGIIVMDDSSLYFDYLPGAGSFAGHPGPSRVAKEISQFQMKLIGGVGHNNIFKKIS